MKDATKLKDAYLAGVANTLGAEAMAEAGAMENAKLAGKLGMDMGDMASVVTNYGTGRIYEINDGIPANVLIDPRSNEIRVDHAERDRMPLRNFAVKDTGFLGIGGVLKGGDMDKTPGIYAVRGFNPHKTPGIVGGRPITYQDTQQYDPRLNPMLKEVEFRKLYGKKPR